ncbi:MAG: hypothetical protein HY349_03225, partial [Nitrospirae bacterium]|nr:hypothetical protein [Nitrospirota bacterium]
VMDLLRDLQRRGHTIILITHDRDLAAQAQRVVTLRDGHVIGDQKTPAPAAPIPAGRS